MSFVLPTISDRRLVVPIIFRRLSEIFSLSAVINRDSCLFYTLQKKLLRKKVARSLQIRMPDYMQITMCYSPSKAVDGLVH